MTRISQNAWGWMILLALMLGALIFGLVTTYWRHQ
jgi:hypothetical protein